MVFFKAKSQLMWTNQENSRDEQKLYVLRMENIDSKWGEINNLRCGCQMIKTKQNNLTNSL